MSINPLYLTDGYKIGHKKMLAKNTTKLYGTWIPRSTKHAPQGVDKIVSFGQQLVWKWLNGQFENYFFNRDWEDLKGFVSDMESYLDLDYDGNHFKDLHDLGYLPIKVKALPEGVETLPNIPHMTFINTVDGFAWLTLYLETIVSSAAWKLTTSATLALQYRRNVEQWVNKTDPDSSFLIPFLCHDFSARGLNPWDMVTSGLGHATSFRGSDTLPVIPAARYYYNEEGVCINSVNASEHSVSTTKIFTVGEERMILDWIREFPKGILSLVADTFDLWKFITEFLVEHKEAILARDGKIVVRPDSGDPVDIICGTISSKYKSLDRFNPEKDKLEEWVEEFLIEGVREETPHGEMGPTEHFGYFLAGGKYYKGTIHNIGWNRYDKQYYFIDMWEKAEITIEEQEILSPDKGVIELLWDIFGGLVNEQGYKVLDPHIGAIYGDSITIERQAEIYKRLEAKGFAATNIVLGVGSFTYQFNTRDTFGFAAKGAWFEVKEDLNDYDDDHDGLHPIWRKVGRNIYKDPVTDDGTKKSLKGLQQVFLNEDGEYEVKSECTWEEESQGELQTIFEDGKLYNETSLTEIRERIDKIV